MAVKVFISYRRADSPYAAAQIYDRLTARFGEDAVFFDVDAIPLSVDFREHVNVAIEQSDVFLAIIGERWLEAGPDGQSRLAAEDDLVRIELESARDHDLAIVPVLVGTATMPSPGELPDSLRFLSYRNAAEVRPGTSLRSHLERLIAGIESLAAQAAAAQAEAEAERARAESERQAAAARAAAQAAEAEALEAQKKAAAARAEALAAETQVARPGSEMANATADPGSSTAVARDSDGLATDSRNEVAAARNGTSDVATSARAIAASTETARSGPVTNLIICCLAGWAAGTVPTLVWHSLAYAAIGPFEADSLSSLLMGVGTLTGFALLAPLGDRWGRRRLILVGMALLLLSSVLAAQFYATGDGPIEVIYAVRVVVGVAYGVMLPNLIALVAGRFGPEKAGRAIAVLLVVSVLVPQLEWVELLFSYVGMVSLFIAAGVLVFLLLAWAATKIGDGDFNRADSFGGSYRAVFQHPQRSTFALLVLAYVMAVAAVALAQFIYWTPLRSWVGVGGGLAIIWAAGHARARRLLLVFCGLGVSAVAIAAVVGYGQEDALGAPMWFFLAAAPIAVLALATPSFPAASRATAVGLAMAVAWLVSFIVDVSGPRFAGYTLSLTLAGLALLAVVGALARIRGVGPTNTLK